MKVAHFCTFPHGGAATAAIRQHRGLQQAGVDSQFYYFIDEKDQPRGDDFSKIEFTPAVHEGPLAAVNSYFAKRRRKRIHRLYDEHLTQRDSSLETYAMAEQPEPGILDWAAIDADIVNLHWISFFADFPSFFKSIPNHIPIVWTLHDTHAFTGGCHYNGDCMKFADGCGNCPQVHSPSPQDVSLASLLAKRKAYRSKKIQVVAPCKWMLDLARRSSVWPAKTPFKKIEYGLDLNKFQPVDQTEARAALKLDPKKRLIAFGAMEIDNPRKGFDHLITALKKTKASGVDCECLVFGSGEIEQTESLPKLNSLGFIDSAERLCQAYSAADVVVVPSIEDNQPQVGLEAMACGTPVIAFDACGLPEYVKDGKTGWLCPVTDADALAEKITASLNGDAKRFGAAALKQVQTRFDVRQQTQKWQQLYRNCLGR